MANVFVVPDASADFIPTIKTGDELLIGCGNSKKKQLATKGRDQWKNLVTLDIDPNAKPDVLWDLEHLPLPWADDTFEEIHAYEVLEHVGKQGDYRGFFALWNELHRILKPGGYVFATCPMWDSAWAWGDPGHTRVYQTETLVFLDQAQYEDQVGKTPMTDYRWLYKGNFSIEGQQETNGHLCFVLKKK
jgi:SAM-dependent methyltransferase